MAGFSPRPARTRPSARELLSADCQHGFCQHDFHSPEIGPAVNFSCPSKSRQYLLVILHGKLIV